MAAKKKAAPSAASEPHAAAPTTPPKTASKTPAAKTPAAKPSPAKTPPAKASEKASAAPTKAPAKPADKAPPASKSAPTKPPPAAQPAKPSAAKPEARLGVKEGPVPKGPAKKKAAATAPKVALPDAKRAAASKPAASPAGARPAAPPAPVKPPPRVRAASLADIEGPDDDDLEDDDDEDEEEEDDEGEPAEEAVAVPPALAALVEAVAPGSVVKKVVARVVPPMPPRKPGVITVAFSPDADDAFMLYGLASGKVDTAGRKYEFVRADIAGLNHEATKGTYDVTAFSFGAWPQVVERYLVLPAGGSLGDQVGPIVISKTPVRSSEVNGLTVAVPGRSTTAALVLKMWLYPNKLNLVEVPFQQVALAVKAGKARAGLLIHEGQLTYKADGLARVVDLGLWWGEKTEGLPLPLGGVAVRRDISPEERTQISLDLKRSIAFALGHREEALDYAMPFGRGLARPLLDKYVTMYVNEMSLDYGERGRQAVHALYDEAVRLGLLKERTDLEFA